jgi:para-nitrobenzyl esterase
MMAMWTQFAKTGNPSVKGMIDWPAYDTTDRYLYIAEPLAVKSGFSKVGSD